MTLGSIVARLKGRGLITEASGIADDVVIDRLTHDSRAVSSRTLFVAIRGGTADGHLFIDKAVKNGAIAVVCEAMPGDAPARFPGIAVISVTDSRAALAELAALLHGDPSSSIDVVGITGTNGKTTTCFLVHHLLNTLEIRCGLIGTILVDLGAGPEPARLTTPNALELQAYLARMRHVGCSTCAMEVSSHALVQHRVRAVDFNVGVFTNLTREHLDYHGTEQAYFAAKKRLFDELKPGSVALYNIDDRCGTAITRDTRARRIAFGRSADADVRLAIKANDLSGLRLELDGREARFRLVGSFNAYNIAAAYGAGIVLGHDRESVLDALTSAPPVPGRFEQIALPEGRTAIVDYAHTADALESVLQTIDELRPLSARIWCVFGCGGDRDRSKRPEMGRIAEAYADHVVVTSDNPRTEDPEAIMNEIRQGFTRPEHALWIEDRREAITRAAGECRPGDVLLIAGKGHETFQIRGHERIHFDDREVIRSAFKAID